MENKEIRAEVICNLGIMSASIDAIDLKNIIEALVKFEDGKEALKRTWRNLINNSNKPEKLICALGEDDIIIKDMLENIPYFLKYANTFNSSCLAKEFAKLEGGNKAIAQNFDGFIDEAIDNFEDIVFPTLETKLGREKIKQRFNEIKNKVLNNPFKSGIINFFKIINALEGVEEFEEIYEDYGYWAKLYEKLIVVPQIENEKDMDKVNESDYQYISNEIEDNYGIKLKKGMKLTLDQIFNLDSKNQEFKRVLCSNDREEKRAILETVANGNEYSLQSSGTSGLVIKAGNQVVKIGSRPRKFDIPYHPRVMMPYFRKRYSDDTLLEVYNLGNTKSAKITDENLLAIYKELEEDGIIWTDAHKENIVELLSDNVLPDFIKSEDFNLFGFLEHPDYPTNNHRVLKKGEIVICDLDMLYVKGDPELKMGFQDEIITKYLISKIKEEANQRE